MKIREVIAFENHFEDFLLEQPQKVQDKIFKIIEAIETLERVPSNYLKLEFNLVLIFGGCFAFLTMGNLLFY